MSMRRLGALRGSGIHRCAVVCGATFFMGCAAYADGECEAPAPVAGAVSYTYDALGRLHQVCYGGDYTVTYTYDPNGNRIATETIDASGQGGLENPGDGGGASIILVPLGNKYLTISVGQSAP